jgi:release factor glutamine methyltransferase
VDAVVERLRAAGCVFAEDEARLLVEAAATPADLDTLVGRRAGGEPLEYVLGWAGFAGLRLVVAPGVFVPRRRTELLAARAVAAARSMAGAPAGAEVGSAARSGVVLVDLCCGAGAVGAAVRAAVPGVRLYAVDLDEAAVRCARRNLAPGDTVLRGDLYDPLPASLRGHVDVLTANAPYVPTGEIPLLPAEARLHEPATALDGGADGLDILRRVLAGAPAWLAPTGVVMVETSAAQAAALAASALAAGLLPQIARDPDLGATALLARRGPP